LCYPQFNDGISVGSLIMLGWPYDAESWRPVRVTAVCTIFGTSYSFEDVDDGQEPKS
jgi:hypothetical protein